MNYNEMITYVDQAVTNSVEESYKLNWINEFEVSVFRDICTEFRTDLITLQKDISSYPLTKCKFEDIQKVTVNDEEYIKMSAIDYDDSSYYKDDQDIAINPIPTVDGGSLKVVYIYKPTPKTESTQYETLEITSKFGQEFEMMYEYYLRWKILFHQREYEEANQMAVMFNDAVRTFSSWYLNNVANSAAVIKKEGWIIR